MKKVIRILFIFIIVFIADNVWAATDSIKWCHPSENKYYEVSFNNEYVNKNAITKEDINLGYKKGHEDDSNYRLEVIETNNSCTSCPNRTAISPFTANKEYDKKNMVNNNLILIDYNHSTKKFDIKFVQEIKEKYYIRLSPSLRENGDTSSRNMSEYNKGYYPGSQFIDNDNDFFAVDPGADVLLEFYEKSSGECDGAFVASQYYKMDNLNDILVDNPALTEPNSAIYKACDKYVRNNPDYSNDAFSINVKKGQVPICYKRDTSDVNEENKITLNEYKNISVENDVTDRLTVLNLLLSGNSALGDENESDNIFVSSSNSCSSGSGTYKCDNESGNKTKKFLIFSNGDFAVNCTDTYSFKGDKSKLTYAGGGFEYGSGVKYSIERKCTISYIGTPAVEKPECTGCACDAVSTYSTGSEQSGHTGPNEEFDNCIYNCDGGTYTQQCINSCYKETYGDDTRRNDIIEKMSVLESNKKVKINNLLNYNNKEKLTLKIGDFTSNGGRGEINNGYSIVETGRENTHHGNEGTGYNVQNSSGQTCQGGHGVFSDWCATGGGNGYVTWYCYNTPGGCDVNARQKYLGEVGTIAGNLGAAVSAMNSALQGLSPGKVSLTIVDSYLKNSNGKFYIFSINSKDSAIKLHINKSGPSPSTHSRNSAQIGIGYPGQSGDKYESWDNKKATLTVNGIEIDATAYIGKIYGNVVYNNGTKNLTISKNRHDNYTLNTVSNFNFSDYYKDKSKYTKYFTSLFSDNKNVDVSNNDLIKLNRECYNIELSVTGLGTPGKSYSFSNSCYYGVYNNYIETEDDVDPDPDPDYSKKGDIKYIFRPIELANMFPDNSAINVDRNPRWNWTDSAILNPNGNDPYLGYEVKPSNTIIHIEEVGNDVYTDDELDYEIIIDGSNIRRIKEYNNTEEYKSYTTFNMECSLGKLCESKFLKFGDYIRNQGSAKVNAKIGTNND